MLDVPKQFRGIILLRAFMGFIGIATLYTGIQLSSTSKATVIWNSGPIFLMIFTRVFRTESAAIFDQISIFLACFGLILL